MNQKNALAQIQTGVKYAKDVGQNTFKVFMNDGTSFYVKGTVKIRAALHALGF